MSSIAARTYLTPEEYIAAERKANNVLSEFSTLEDRLSPVPIGTELPLHQIYRFIEFETDDSLETARSV